MRTYLDLARRELGRLDGAVDTDTRSAICRDCDDLEAWLRRPGRREWLCS
jgi:hypothetical protein